VSADGMIVAFASNAADLNADHPAGTTQIYVLDRRKKQTRLISRADGFDGAPGAGSSTQPSISADGRYVAFVTASNNISDEDGTDNQDVYVRDTMTNKTRLVSRTVAGGASSGTSNQPAISPDGRYVAFSSNANNLSANDADGTKDIYVHDRVTRDSQLVSIGIDGLPALGDSTNPDISLGGGVVTYESTAGNLASGDAALLSDVFAIDVKTLKTSLISRGSGVDGSSPVGASFAPSISADGRYVAFESDANLTSGANPLLRDVFVRDRTTNDTILVSRQSGPAGAASDLASDEPDISPDGGFVAFRSAGTNLSSLDRDPDTDVFVRDLSDGALSLASRATGGPAANGPSSEPALAAAAGSVAYASRATNLTSPAPGGGTNVYSTSLRGTLSVTATEPPEINAALSRFDTDVTCNLMCVIWATGKITVSTADGQTLTRNAAGYGAQAVTAGATRNIAVYLLPASVSWLKRHLEAGATASVEIKLEGFGMRGEKATAYSRGPITLPAPAPAAG
jgi:Tol biopolymer transport system component